MSVLVGRSSSVHFVYYVNSGVCEKLHVCPRHILRPMLCSHPTKRTAPAGVRVLVLGLHINEL